MVLKLKNRILVLFGLLLISQCVASQVAKKLTLSEVCELAIANSKQLKLATVGMEMSQTATQLARTALTPTLNVSVSGTYIGNGFITNRDFSNYHSVKMPHWGNSFALEATQVIFAGGAISTSIKKTELEKQLAQLSYDRNELDICFLETGYYLDLYKLKNQCEIFEKNIEQTRLLIDQVKLKESQGMALTSDITRHELLLQNMKLSLIEIENNRKIINQQMVTTLGLPEETIILPDSSVLNLDLSTVTFDKLMQLANENLPDVKMASLSKEVALKDIHISKADYYPQVALTAANSFNGPILIEVPVIDKNFNYWYVGVGLRYNIDALYKSSRKVRMANQKRTVAEYSEALVLEQTKERVYNAYVKFVETTEKLTVNETSLRLANENYRIINNRYLNELVLITEMLDASNAKLNAELQVVNAKLDVIYSYYRLQREIGNKIIK